MDSNKKTDNFIQLLTQETFSDLSKHSGLSPFSENNTDFQNIENEKNILAFKKNDLLNSVKDKAQEVFELVYIAKLQVFRLNSKRFGVIDFPKNYSFFTQLSQSMEKNDGQSFFQLSSENDLDNIFSILKFDEVKSLVFFAFDKKCYLASFGEESIPYLNKIRMNILKQINELKNQNSKQLIDDFKLGA